MVVELAEVAMKKPPETALTVDTAVPTDRPLCSSASTSTSMAVLWLDEAVSTPPSCPNAPVPELDPDAPLELAPEPQLGNDAEPEALEEYPEDTVGPEPGSDEVLPLERESEPTALEPEPGPVPEWEAGDEAEPEGAPEPAVPEDPEPESDEAPPPELAPVPESELELELEPEPTLEPAVALDPAPEPVSELPDDPDDPDPAPAAEAEPGPDPCCVSLAAADGRLELHVRIVVAGAQPPPPLDCHAGPIPDGMSTSSCVPLRHSPHPCTGQYTTTVAGVVLDPSASLTDTSA